MGYQFASYNLAIVTTGPLHISEGCRCAQQKNGEVIASKTGFRNVSVFLWRTLDSGYWKRESHAILSEKMLLNLLFVFQFFLFPIFLGNSGWNTAIGNGILFRWVTAIAVMMLRMEMLGENIFFFATRTRCWIGWKQM